MRGKSREGDNLAKVAQLSREDDVTVEVREEGILSEFGDEFQGLPRQ